MRIALDQIVTVCQQLILPGTKNVPFNLDESLRLFKHGDLQQRHHEGEGAREGSEAEAEGGEEATKRGVSTAAVVETEGEEVAPPR